MTQQLFPITGRRPTVLINMLAGNLNVQPWETEAISVESEAPIIDLRQEGDTLILTDCKSDLTLRVPALRKAFFAVRTDIIGTQLSRSATIEGAGNVELQDVGGNVTLKNIAGNVELESIHEVAELISIGGNLRAQELPRLRVQQGVGGNVTLSNVTKGEIDTVGGNLTAERIEVAFYCSMVGGNGSIEDSEHAEVTLGTVGGNLNVDSASYMQAGNVGGNLDVRAGFPPESHTSIHAGGNATLSLPDNTNLSVSAFVGGNVSGSNMVFRKGGGSVTLVYGEGAATLDIHVGGNLRLLGSANPQSAR